MAARDAGVERFFYASSRLRLRRRQADRPDVTALREDDAYPAMPEDGYGWEKLFSERMCRHFREDFGLATRVARYHNVYGPHGTWDGGREKAPAAICRKVVEAKLTGDHEIEIWGDGEQTRSFMYIDDCVEGTQMILDSDITEPINLGSDELVTINELVDIVEEIAGVRLQAQLRPQRPAGRARPQQRQHPDPRELGWEPSITPGRRHASGPTPGSTTRSSARSAEPAMRILVHDFSGHPFQAELSRELARARPRGRALVLRGLRLRQGHARRRRAGGVALRADRRGEVSTSRDFARRLVQELRYGVQLVRQVRRRRPDVVLVANAPIPTLVVLAASSGLRRMPWVLWHQDVQAVAIALVRRRQAAPARSGWWRGCSGRPSAGAPGGRRPSW